MEAKQANWGKSKELRVWSLSTKVFIQAAVKAAFLSRRMRTLGTRLHLHWQKNGGMANVNLALLAS